MKRIETACVDCPPEKVCRGSACPNRRPVTTYVCDECGIEGEREDFRVFGDKELCAECFLEAAWSAAKMPEEVNERGDY